MTFYTQSRIFYAMALDNTFPQFLNLQFVHNGIPRNIILLSGVIASIASAILPLSYLGELSSLGILISYVSVNLSAVVCKASNISSQYDQAESYQVPIVVPILGGLSCLILVIISSIENWYRCILYVWLAIGFMVFAASAPEVPPDIILEEEISRPSSILK